MDPPPQLGQPTFEQQSRLRSAILRSVPTAALLNLLSTGASATGEVDDEGGNPTLPLHLAAYKGRARLAEALLDAGARADQRDQRGRLPRDGALRRGKVARRVARLLITRGSPRFLSPPPPKAAATAAAAKDINEDEELIATEAAAAAALEAEEREWVRRAVEEGADEGDEEENNIGNLDSSDDDDDEAN